ncbi:MAG: ASKHA domain-containing protein [Anaerobutyricum sp.]
MWYLALEGGNIACGMRGTNGAIERKFPSKIISLLQSAIGEGTPQGLCGSAIIDAVAELRKAGLIDEAGTLLDPDECRRMNPYSPWIRYLHEAEE